MSTEQALNIIIQAAEAAPLPKAVHVQVAQAIQVIIEALKVKAQ